MGHFPLALSNICGGQSNHIMCLLQLKFLLVLLQNPDYLDFGVQERERLYNLLKEVPYLKPHPSYSNFILCEVTSGKDAKRLKEDRSQIGIMIRHYGNKELKGYARISVGKPEHTDALIQSLKLRSW